MSPLRHMKWHEKLCRRAVGDSLRALCASRQGFDRGQELENEAFVRKSQSRQGQERAVM